MAQEIVLHFETEKGEFPNTEVVALALLDWTTLVRNAILVIDPNERIEFEIVGVNYGSTRIPQLLKFADEQIGHIKSAWDDYPHLKGIVVGSAHVLWTATVAAGVSLAMQPDQQDVRLSDEDRRLLRQIGNAPLVQDASRRFYRTLEKDTSIQGVGVADNWTDKPAVIVPRSEFPERGGVWSLEAQDPQERIQHDIWDVVLLRPALISTPHSWQFLRDGFKFSAQMHDAIFLEAIREGRVPLTLQEGVTMRVEVEYRERLNGQVWELVPNSRRIARVLSPAVR